MAKPFVAWLTVSALLGPTAISGRAQEPRSRHPDAMQAAFHAFPIISPQSGPLDQNRLNKAFEATANREETPAITVPQQPKSRELPRKRASGREQQPRAKLLVPERAPTMAYQRTFKILLSRPEVTDQWDPLIIRHAQEYKLDSRLLKSIMAAESEFDPNALSPSGARGLMQVMPATAREIGIESHRLYDPESGIRAGAAYLQILFRAAWKLFHLKGVRYTDAPAWVIQRVVAAYHAGPKFLLRQDLHAATKAYVKKVILFYRSKVTDIRRTPALIQNASMYNETITSSGSLH